MLRGNTCRDQEEEEEEEIQLASWWVRIEPGVCPGPACTASESRVKVKRFFIITTSLWVGWARAR